MECFVENSDVDHQFVHVTGNAFVLILSSTCLRARSRVIPNIIRRNRDEKRYPILSEQPSPHEAYITRHVSGKNRERYDINKKVQQLFKNFSVSN